MSRRSGSKEPTSKPTRTRRNNLYHAFFPHPNFFCHTTKEGQGEGS